MDPAHPLMGAERPLEVVSGGALEPLGTPGTEPPAIMEDVPPDQLPPAGDGAGGDDRDDYKVVLDVMRGLADQEFDRGERLSTKARQSFAFIGVLFAGTQTIVLTTLASYFTSTGQQTAIIVMAGVAMVATAVTGALALAADSLKSFANLSSQDVLDSANDSMESGEPVAADLTQLYATAVDERREAVKKRRGWLVKAQIAAAVTIFVLSAELLYALYVRLPSA